MTELGGFRCRNCNMTFHSRSLLDKHKENFCIGSEIGDPFALNQRFTESWDQGGGHSSAWRGGGPKRTHTPDFVMLREQKNHLQRHSPSEEQASERERGAGRGYGLEGTGVSDSLALRKLTDEFHKLRMSIQESMPTFPAWVPEVETSPRLHREWEHKDRVREIAETHGRHLAEIQARNRDLEQKRDEIQRRLSELATQDTATGHIETMLLEMRAQEQRNQLALDELREQIESMQAEAASKAEPVTSGLANTALPGEKKDLRVSFNTIPFTSGSGTLSSEIRALRLAYLQSGGTEPVILAQMHDLQVEAHTLERPREKPEPRNKKRRPEASHRALDTELLTVEMENQRLEDEILKLQLHREKRKGEEELADSGLQEMQMEHMQQMAGLQAEIEILKQNAERTRAPRGRRTPPPLLPPPPALPPPPPLYPPPPPLYPPPPGMHQPAFRPGAMGHTKPQTPLMGKHVLDPPEALGPSPYDPAAGFVIFYDFLLGLEPSLRMVRLVAGLYNSGQEMGRPTPLPGVHCEVGGALQYVTEGYPGNLAVLSVKQPVPRVRPSPSISLVVELQASGGFDTYGQEIQRLVTRGWTKIDIFDHHNQVISGFWKIPIRVLPVRPSLTTGQLNGVPQTGGAELYLRVVNARDADMQSLANMDPGNALAYKYPSMVSARTVAHAENPPLHLTPYHPSTNHYLSVPSHIDQIDPPPVEPGPVQHRANQSVPEVSAQTGAAEEPDEKSVGFIVDRVSDAPSGDGSLRLTGYSQRTGRVIFTKHSGMVCSTSAVKSSIKKGCFIFGEQEMIFRDVEPQADMVLIVRFYHWPGGSDATAPWDGDGSLQGLSDREECAVAWGTLALTRPAAPHKHSRVCAEVVWNSGTHSVPLYHVPAPPAIGLNALPGDRLVEAFEPYGTASVRLHMYSGTRPEFPFPPESPIDTRVYQEWPDTAFIYRQRERAPSQPFVSGDGIELYIDGARFLPDSVTLSRVTGRIFNRNYNQIGPDISTGIDLNSNIFEPFYNHHVEVRNPTMPPSATLLLKVYAVDRFSLKLVLIGWAALSLFVESGSQSQPSVDTTAVQISLNEGAHQLRLYHRGPDPDKPLSASSLAAGGGRRVPCASLLVRLVKAPVDKNHRALLRSTVPEADWERLGLFQPRPRYSDGVYYSDTAKPSQGEACLHSAMTNRSVVLVREILDLIAGSRAQELGSDLEISEWIKDKLNRMMDSKPKPFDLDHVSRYLTSYGVKVSVDRAKNLPWPAFTLALCSFSPPAAFYHGASRVRYDRPAFVEKLDFNSSQSAPVWLDGFKSFPKRIHDKFLAVVVHLHAVSVHSGQDAPRKDKRDKKEKREESEREVLTYSLGAQAWTALPVFSRGYCHTGVYQLPLYQGAPSQAALAALSQGECWSVLGDLVQKNKVQRLKGASVFVRIADGRRDEELEGLSEKETDQCYLPPDQRDSYSVEHGGAGLSQLIPAGKSRDEFPGQLANRFRQLVYQTLRNTAENSTGPALMELSKDGVETAALPPLPAPHARTADLKPNPTNTAQPSNAAPHILQTPSLRIPRSESAQQHPPKPPSAPPPPELLRARVPSSL